MDIQTLKDKIESLDPKAHKALRNVLITEYNRLTGEKVEAGTQSEPASDISAEISNRNERCLDKERITHMEKAIIFDVETDSLDIHKAKLMGIGFYMDGKASFIDCQNHVLIEELRTIFSKPDYIYCAHNIKFDWHILLNYGVDIAGNIFDTMIAASLLGKNGLGLKERCRDAGEQMKHYDEINSNKIEELAEYCKKDCEVTFKLFQVYRQMIDSNCKRLFWDVEMPLVKRVLEMERRGVEIDRKYLENLRIELMNEIPMRKEKVYLRIGNKINLNSSTQLSDLFFNKMKLTPIGYTPKGQLSVDKEILKSLAEQGVEVANEILIYRERQQLLSTFVGPILEKIDEQNRLYSNFNQVGADTGRFTSSKPNLQNIPKGSLIRKAFVASVGKKLIVADYSNIELRLIAHLSNDKVMIDAFNKEKADLHSETASKIFRKPIENISEEERQTAKTINFGVIYGMHPTGLAKTLKIPLSQAEDYIKKYFDTYKGVEIFRREIIKECREFGCVETIWGRRRYFPEIKNLYNIKLESRARRQAVNMAVQGSAADIIKLAMVEIYREFKDKGVDMLLQVHDELVFEAPGQITEEAAASIRKIMEEVIKLRVPLVVDISIGDCWE